MNTLFKRRDAYAVFLFQEFTSSFLFALAFTVNLVYQVTVGNLNPLQLVLVGTVLEATAFVFQVPTGVVADVYSRRASVIVGFTLVGAGMVLQGAIPRFESILLSSFISGVGYTFLSGALEAWLSDEVGQQQAGRAYLRGSQWASLGGLAGILPSVALASRGLQLPVVLAGAGLVALAGCLLVAMPERGFRPTPRAQRNSFQQMAHTFTGGWQLVHGHSVLITILVIEAIYGAFSEGYDRLWTPHLLQNFAFPALDGMPPVVWFGMIRAASLLLSLGVNELAQRGLDTNRHAVVTRALLAINSLIAASMIALGLAGHFAMACAAILALNSVRRTGESLSIAWLNQSLEPEMRATVFSMHSQFNALGQILGGPLVGAIATGISLRAALVLSGVMLVPALLLYMRTSRRLVGPRAESPDRDNPRAA